jgi:hypothetical protein
VIRPLLLVVAVAISGCRVDREYVYIQTEDGTSMKAPITHTVRVRLDTLNKVLTWLEDVKDSRGVENRSMKTYGGDRISECEIFDDQNWTCVFTGAKGEALEKPVMKDGQLTRWYWVLEEKYATRYRVFGRQF